METKEIILKNELGRRNSLIVGRNQNKAVITLISFYDALSNHHFIDFEYQKVSKFLKRPRFFNLWVKRLYALIFLFCYYYKREEI